MFFSQANNHKYNSSWSLNKWPKTDLSDRILDEILFHKIQAQFATYFNEWKKMKKK